MYLKLILSTILFLSITYIRSEDEYIIGGKITTIETFPYQISLHNLGSHICGGAIINPSIVLTAGHCVSGKYIWFLSIRVGSSDRRIGGEYVKISRIMTHDRFNNSNFDNDIALLKLTDFLKFGDAIQPIALPKIDDHIKPNAEALVSGWGLLREGSSKGSDMLLYTTLRILDFEICSKLYSKQGKVVTENMLCAAADGQDSCKGDSGGPLVMVSNKSRVLYGIVSWGLGCARAESPGVYTNVAKMRPWIDAKIKELVV